MKKMYCTIADTISETYKGKAFPLINELIANIDSLINELKRCEGNLFDEASQNLEKYKNQVLDLEFMASNNLQSIINKSQIFDSWLNKYNNTKINDSGLILRTYRKEVGIPGILMVPVYEDITEVIPEMKNFTGGPYN